ncbi:PREDICTED: uncharacterized protein LOC108564459 [Nicrophorus vespilloides]|uniref:Uncharacterized protein LOC108564459 n=1 Tax=Nicrophorus vespilloides TaxID=110193 RepID=A0ABM1MWQ7_NICVS|nr:PREDICTED: uncharacterized protein LOC108564459 [Nicrophorus vespilloides]
MRECIVLIVNTTGTCIGCGTIYIIIFTTFMSDHIVHRIIHLKSLLMELRSMERGWARNEHMKYCIRYHQNIIEFSVRLSNFSENLYLLYVCITAIILSLISCEAIVKLEYLPFWHGVLYFIPLHLSASAGEHLYENSINISFVIFGSVPWDGDLKLQKDMLFMMTRTNVALTLRIGKFTTYSRPFMLSVLKLWYSLFTLLIKIL